MFVPWPLLLPKKPLVLLGRRLVILSHFSLPSLCLSLTLGRHGKWSMVSPMQLRLHAAECKNSTHELSGSGSCLYVFSMLSVCVFVCGVSVLLLFLVHVFVVSILFVLVMFRFRSTISGRLTGSSLFAVIRLLSVVVLLLLCSIYTTW